MNRRITSILFMLLAIALLCTARAAYLESDVDSGLTTPTDEIVRPLPRPDPSPRNAFTDLVRRLDIGRPWSHGHLTVYPLQLNAARALDIRTLDEAFDRGWITVREKDTPLVAVLQVRNNSAQTLFLMNGEMLAGGKQNRMVKDDLLLRPNSDFIDVSVYCGEKGRWSPRFEPFGSGGEVAHFGLRRSAAMSEAQGDIWNEIDAQSARSKVKSPTQDYQTIYREESVRETLDEYAGKFRGFGGESVVGGVAVSGGRIIGADIFSDPSLFSALWGKLLRAYTLEAVSHDHRQSSISSADIRRFLDRGLSARFRTRSTPGAGELLEIVGAVDGTALIWNNHLVHASLFDTQARPIPPPEPLPPPRPPWWGRPPPRPLPPEPVPPHPIPVPLPGPVIDDNIWNFRMR